MCAGVLVKTMAAEAGGREVATPTKPKVCGHSPTIRASLMHANDQRQTAKYIQDGGASV